MLMILCWNSMRLHKALARAHTHTHARTHARTHTHTHTPQPHMLSQSFTHTHWNESHSFILTPLPNPPPVFLPLSPIPRSADHIAISGQYITAFVCSTWQPVHQLVDPLRTNEDPWKSKREVGGRGYIGIMLPRKTLRPVLKCQNGLT